VGLTIVLPGGKVVNTGISQISLQKVMLYKAPEVGLGK